MVGAQIVPKAKALTRRLCYSNTLYGFSMLGGHLIDENGKYKIPIFS